MFCQIQMKELFMIIIERRFSSIKIKCQRKILSNIVLALIFGSIFQFDALKGTMMIKDRFIMFTEMYSKKSKPKKQKHLNQETIWRNKWENMKGLVFPTQTLIKYWVFTMIGKTLQHTKHSLGAKNMIPEMLKIDG